MEGLTPKNGVHGSFFLFPSQYELISCFAYKELCFKIIRNVDDTIQYIYSLIDDKDGTRKFCAGETWAVTQ